MRCNADFIQLRVKEGLIRILSSIKLHKPLPKPDTPYFCQVVPEQINLGLDPAARTQLSFYGFDLDAGLVAVSVADDKGETPISPNTVATPTPYLLTVNISDTNGVLLAGKKQIIFRLSPGGVTHAVNIVAPPPPAKTLSIVDGTSYDVDGGGGTGGNGPFTRLCPPGMVGTGIQGRSGDRVDRIELMCGNLNADGTLGSLVGTTADGGGGGGPFPNQTCPSGQLLVGLFGASGDRVDKIGGQCNTPAAVVGQTGSVSTIGPAGGSGGSPFAAACKPQYVVTGFVIRSGTEVDHIGFICAQIALK